MGIKYSLLVNLSARKNVLLMTFTHLDYTAARILDTVHRRSCFRISFDHEKLENLSPFSQQKTQKSSTKITNNNIIVHVRNNLIIDYYHRAKLRTLILDW